MPTCIWLFCTVFVFYLHNILNLRSKINWQCLTCLNNWLLKRRVGSNSELGVNRYLTINGNSCDNRFETAPSGLFVAPPRTSITPVYNMHVLQIRKKFKSYRDHLHLSHIIKFQTSICQFHLGAQFFHCNWWKNQILS